MVLRSSAPSPRPSAPAVMTARAESAVGRRPAAAVSVAFARMSAMDSGSPAGAPSQVMGTACPTPTILSPSKSSSWYRAKVL
jgi:hypothetical protein